MKASKIVIASALLLGALGSGCSAATSAGGEPVGQSQEQVVGTDTFLYFRSNATGWGVDENTRLLPFAASGIFARAVTPSETWMVTDGDTAIVTETNQLDGWGTAQTFSGPASKLMSDPDNQPLVDQAPGGDAHFKIKYSSQLLQRVLVDTTVTPRKIFVEPITCSCPSPTHCVIGANSMPNCVI